MGLTDLILERVEPYVPDDVSDAVDGAIDYAGDVVDDAGEAINDAIDVVGDAIDSESEFVDLLAAGATIIFPVILPLTANNVERAARRYAPDVQAFVGEVVERGSQVIDRVEQEARSLIQGAEELYGEAEELMGQAVDSLEEGVEECIAGIFGEDDESQPNAEVVSEEHSGEPQICGPEGDSGRVEGDESSNAIGDSSGKVDESFDAVAKSGAGTGSESFGSGGDDNVSHGSMGIASAGDSDTLPEGVGTPLDDSRDATIQSVTDDGNGIPDTMGVSSVDSTEPVVPGVNDAISQDGGLAIASAEVGVYSYVENAMEGLLEVLPVVGIANDALGIVSAAVVPNSYGDDSLHVSTEQDPAIPIISSGIGVVSGENGDTSAPENSLFAIVSRLARETLIDIESDPNVTPDSGGNNPFGRIFGGRGPSLFGGGDTGSLLGQLLSTSGAAVVTALPGAALAHPVVFALAAIAGAADSSLSRPFSQISQVLLANRGTQSPHRIGQPTRQGDPSHHFGNPEGRREGGSNRDGSEHDGHPGDQEPVPDHQGDAAIGLVA
jgi:hypothetical protein